MPFFQQIKKSLYFHSFFHFRVILSFLNSFKSLFPPPSVYILLLLYILWDFVPLNVSFSWSSDLFFLHWIPLLSSPLLPSRLLPSPPLHSPFEGGFIVCYKIRKKLKATEERTTIAPGSWQARVLRLLLTSLLFPKCAPDSLGWVNYIDPYAW